LTTIYRLLGEPPELNSGLPESFQPKPHKGGLAFATRGEAREGKLFLTTRPDGQGSAFAMPRDQIEVYRDFAAPKAADFDALLDYYLMGREVMPNLKPVENQRSALDRMCLAGWIVRSGHVRTDPMVPHSRWARVFLSTQQFGGLSGNGLMIVYSGTMRPDDPQLYEFALCEHQVKTGPNANPSRGWHPSVCTKCGLNTSVDSSD
jgi:hypothetical protein